MHSRISGPRKTIHCILHPSHQSITVYPDNKYFASAAERVDISVGTLRSNDADGNEKVKKKNKTIGLISKITTSHVHHTFFCTFLSRFCTTTT